MGLVQFTLPPSVLGAAIFSDGGLKALAAKTPCLPPLTLTPRMIPLLLMIP